MSAWPFPRGKVCPQVPSFQPGFHMVLHNLTSSSKARSKLSWFRKSPSPWVPSHFPVQTQAHTLDELGQFPSLGHAMC